MPLKTIKLLNGREALLAYATGKNGWAGQYFNSKRYKNLKAPTAAEQYKKKIDELSSVLTASLDESKLEFDAVICAKSSGDDARPYLSAILQRWTIPDFSDRFERDIEIKAADGDTTVADLTGALTYARCEDEVSLKSILIVDESLATSKTTTAIVEKLRAAGLSDDCKVTIAVCAWLDKEAG